MKKIFAVVLILILACSLVACSGVSRLYCNGCGEVSLSKKHKVKVMGKKVYMCDDCYDQVDWLFD